jgi:hypothetical protein
MSVQFYQSTRRYIRSCTSHVNAGRGAKEKIAVEEKAKNNKTDRKGGKRGETKQVELSLCLIN